MLRVKAGDVAAFRMLVYRYREPLRRFFAAVLPDRSLADDCAQETFLRLWVSRERYEPAGRFSTYLFEIGKRHWLNERRRLRPATEPEEAAATTPADPREQPERLLLRRHDARY